MQVRRSILITVGTLGAAAASGLIADELHHRAASRHIPSARSVALVVLGFPSRRDNRPHPVQIWRVKLALRTIARHGADTIVFSGAPPRPGAPSEAEAMADIATSLGYPGPTNPAVILETNATSTWENVHGSAPLVEGADIVILVSDPLHARRAQRYWHQQHPGDTDRVFVTDGSPRFADWWMKIPTAAVSAVRWRAVAVKHRLGFA